MVSPAEGKQAPQDPGLELFTLSESLLGPDRKSVEIVSGEPTAEGDHFGTHLYITPDWDDKTSKRTDGIRIQVISDRIQDRDPFKMPQIKVSPDGRSISRRFRYIDGHVYEKDHPTLDYELAKLLSSIHDGRVIDPETEVVVDRSSSTEPKLPPMRRVYKKKSMRRLGRSITDKALGFVIAD